MRIVGTTAGPMDRSPAATNKPLPKVMASSLSILPTGPCRCGVQCAPSEDVATYPRSAPTATKIPFPKATPYRSGTPTSFLPPYAQVQLVPFCDDQTVERFPT